MKAILISPADRSVSFVEVITPQDVEEVVGTTCIDRQTVSLHPHMTVFVDDNGIAKKLPAASINSPLIRGNTPNERRLAVYGNTVIVAADDDNFIDASDAHVKFLDVRFNQTGDI